MKFKEILKFKIKLAHFDCRDVNKIVFFRLLTTSKLVNPKCLVKITLIETEFHLNSSFLTNFK